LRALSISPQGEIRPTQLSYQHEIEMVINLKLTKALDLIVSLVLLGRADEMIE
jgi:hypothetical protein